MRPGGNVLVYLVIYIIVPKIAGSGESVRKKYKLCCIFVSLPSA